MESGKEKGNYCTMESFSQRAWRKHTVHVSHPANDGRHTANRKHPAGSKYPADGRRLGSQKQSMKKKRRFHTRLPPKWLIRNIAEGLLLSAGVAFLFYRSAWAMLAGAVLIPLYMKRRRMQWFTGRKQRLQQQFISAMQIVSGSLTAGYSMENAWRNAQQDLNRLYGPEAEFCVELRRMNQKLAMNEQLEQVLFEFASDCGVEDIYNFAEIFYYVKRSGGNLTEIIGATIERMQEKAEILAEIENVVASGKMEQRMMNLLLPGLLLFVTISSPSYSGILYHNVLGILVMSICLAGYIFCFWWAERLTDIAV